MGPPKAINSVRRDWMCAEQIDASDLWWCRDDPYLGWNECLSGADRQSKISYFVVNSTCWRVQPDSFSNTLSMALPMAFRWQQLHAQPGQHLFNANWSLIGLLPFLSCFFLFSSFFPFFLFFFPHFSLSYFLLWPSPFFPPLFFSFISFLFSFPLRFFPFCFPFFPFLFPLSFLSFSYHFVYSCALVLHHRAGVFEMSWPG